MLCLLLLTLNCRAENFALIVGVENYQNATIPRFDGAAADAARVAQALEQSGTVAAPHLRVLTDERGDKPTCAALLAALDALARETKAGDTVIFYFGGHALVRENATFLLPLDTNLTDAKTLKETALDAATWQEKWQKIPAKFSFWALDTNRATFGAFTTRQIQDLIRADSTKNLTALFSCAPQQFGLPLMQETNFASAVARGVSGAAANAQGEIEAGALANYVRHAVSFAAQMQFRKMQTPSVTIAPRDALHVLATIKSASGVSGETALPVTFEPGDDAGKRRVLESLQRGYELFADGKMRGAQQQFEAVGQSDENDASDELKARASLMLGMIARDFQSDGNAASKYLQQAHELDARWAQPLVELGQLFLSQKDYQNAERELTAALELEPQNNEAKVLRGRLFHFGKNDLDRAEKSYREVLQNNPNDTAALNGLGNVWFDRFDFKQAAVVFRHAVFLEPDTPSLRMNFANALLHLERRDEAREQAQLALQDGYGESSEVLQKLNLKVPPTAPKVLAGESATDLLQAGETLLARGQFRAAQLKAQAALAGEALPVAEQARALTLLGLVDQQFFKDGRGAEKLWRQAMALDENAGWPRFHLGVLLMAARQDYAGATPLLERARQLLPNEAAPLSSLGELAYQRFDYQAAQQSFERALVLNPQYAPAMNNLGILQMNARRDYDAAEKMFRRAMETDPQFALPVSNLAMLQMNTRRDFTAAEALLRRAVELEPQEGLYYANLAFCLLRLKRRDEAVSAAARARELGSVADHPVFSLLKEKAQAEPPPQSSPQSSPKP